MIRWKNKDKSSNKGSATEMSGSKKKRKFGKEASVESNGSTDIHGRRDGSTVTEFESKTFQSKNNNLGVSRSRDESRRHIPSNDQQSSALSYQQLNAFPHITAHSSHLHHLPLSHSYYRLSASHTKMELESPLPRGFPTSTNLLFDDDPGIMSEVETSSTGFRRGGKQRSSLPVVRTPSKTLERPLGLVFLQYRNETKRALLPNEITSIDTVKALFVRSFSKQLTMEYLDSPHVKIYIHDSNKDMFYELEDLRSHLRDIRDRCVLRLFESDGGAGMPRSINISSNSLITSHWEDPSYFSEPEFDSEFQHQHIHKSKNNKNSSSPNFYARANDTFSKNGVALRSYSPVSNVRTGSEDASVAEQYQISSTPDCTRGESGYVSSPEKNSNVDILTSTSSNGNNIKLSSNNVERYSSGSFSTSSSYEDPYYTQYSGTVTPVIDEEARIRVEHMERQLANLTGLVQKALTHTPHSNSSSRDFSQVSSNEDSHTRMTDEIYSRVDIKPPKLSKDKSVSFEKSVSFSDEPPDMNSPKQHSPQRTADTKPTKPAIKSSTLPRMSSHEKEKSKPLIPPKPIVLNASQYVFKDFTFNPELYNHLRNLQKKTKDLRQDVKNLRRMSQAQSHTVRETIRDAFIVIRTMLSSHEDKIWVSRDIDKHRLNRKENMYKQEMQWLENDLSGLETTVEELRNSVINRKLRVNMSDVENMALILSKASKTVADLKLRFPNFQGEMRALLSSKMENIMKEEKFLKEEPERLESALKRCKKLTGTLVTLKRLASVQEQRLPNPVNEETEEETLSTATFTQQIKATVSSLEYSTMGTTFISGEGDDSTETHVLPGHLQRSENALDALLDELQTFSSPVTQQSQSLLNNKQHFSHLKEFKCLANSNTISSSGRIPSIAKIGRKRSIDDSYTNLLNVHSEHSETLRRLHSYPSGSDADTLIPVLSDANEKNDDLFNNSTCTKPPVPERNIELLQIINNRRIPPLPPPRTSSRSPLASPTSPQLPPKNINTVDNTPKKSCSSRCNASIPLTKALSENDYKASSHDVYLSATTENNISTKNSVSCENVNLQEVLQKKEHQKELEQRHQELLRKQKALQEQYTRLQQLQRNASNNTAENLSVSSDSLKKTGSESNLLVRIDTELANTTSASLESLTNEKFIQNQISNLALSENSSFNSENSKDIINIIKCTISDNSDSASSTTIISKVYETDIL